MFCLLERFTTSEQVVLFFRTEPSKWKFLAISSIFVELVCTNSKRDKINQSLILLTI